MRKFTWLLALAIPVTIISCQKDAVQTPANEDAALVQGQTVTGNGSESGAHYNLNIIGVSNPKDATMDDNNGHRIFVKLGTKGGATATSNIYLTPGSTFGVLDANGTDQDGAEFMLPHPDGIDANLDGDFVDPGDVAPDGKFEYKVYVRALGGPNGGNAVMTPCAWGYTIDGYEEVCSTVALPLQSGSKPKFVEVSEDLLTITVAEDIYDETGENILIDAGETVNIFDPALENYFWKYDNNGLKLVQLRFYPATANVQ